MQLNKFNKVLQRDGAGASIQSFCPNPSGCIVTTIPAPSITPAVFTGVGLDDATSGGTFTGTETLNIRAEIDLADVTDTFRWSKDGGVTWEATGVVIDGTAQALVDGVTITFGATTGHTLGDYWDFQAIRDEYVLDATSLMAVKFKADQVVDIVLDDNLNSTGFPEDANTPTIYWLNNVTTMKFVNQNAVDVKLYLQTE